MDGGNPTLEAVALVLARADPPEAPFALDLALALPAALGDASADDDDAAAVVVVADICCNGVRDWPREDGSGRACQCGLLRIGLIALMVAEERSAFKDVGEETSCGKNAKPLCCNRLPLAEALISWVLCCIPATWKQHGR